jgi:predicted lipid-binding transport protein (Tim44 family)
MRQYDDMDAHGLIAGLTDLSFSEFITTKIIKVLYVLCIIMAALMGLGMFIGGAQAGPGGAIAGLIMGALFFAVYVLFIRVSLEVLIVIFRIAENTRDMRMMMAEKGAANLANQPPATAQAGQTTTASPVSAGESRAEPSKPAEPEAEATGPAPEDVADEAAENTDEDSDEDDLEFELQ